MKRFLYILVLLFMVPSTLLAGKWDGEYSGDGDVKFECPPTTDPRFHTGRNWIFQNNTLRFSFSVKDGKLSGMIRTFAPGAHCMTISERLYQISLNTDGSFRHSFSIQTTKTNKIVVNGNLNNKTISLSNGTISNEIVRLKKSSGPSNTPIKKKQTSQNVQTVASSQSGGKWDGVYKIISNANTSTHRRKWSSSGGYIYEGVLNLNFRDSIINVIKNNGKLTVKTANSISAQVTDGGWVRFNLAKRQMEINLKSLKGKIQYNDRGEVKSINISLKKISGPPNSSTGTTQSTSPPDPLSNAFRALFPITRKDIQKVLKERGLYTSSIDGLYGKGTRNAIIGFFKDKGLSDDLESMDLRKELLIIANLNLIKEKEKQEQLRKERELADKKDQERLQKEKLAKERKEKEARENEREEKENVDIRNLIKGKILEKVNNNWNVIALKNLKDFEKYVVTLEVLLNPRGEIIGPIKVVKPKKVYGNFVLAKRVATNAIIDSAPFKIPESIFPTGLNLQITFDPRTKEQLLRKAIKIEKEKAFNEKVNAYKEESSDLINDIKNYITNNDDFDVIQLGKRFVEVEKLSKSGWGQKTVEAYENLRNFVFSSEDFKTYYDEQVKERLNTYQNNLETVKNDLKEQLPVIKKFIADNLGSEKVGQAIELGEVIKELVVSDSLESLENLKGTVNKWLKKNGLVKSEIAETTPKEKSEQKKVIDTKTSKKVSVKVNARSFDLVKEVGDGFDNFEAMENTFLLPLIIDIQSTSKNSEKKLTFELALEGMVPILPDVKGSEAFGAQEEIDYFDGNLSLKSKRNIGVVFVIPIQGINKEEGMLSLFIDKTLSNETKVKISK